MTPTKLAETVLYQLEHFWIIQELDHESCKGDKFAVGFLDKIYAAGPTNWRGLVPFMRLNTTLTCLAIPISFASRFSDDQLAAYGFNIRSEHRIYFEGTLAEGRLSPHDVLKTLRNSIAHLPDYAAGEGQAVDEPNISFDSGILRCWTRSKVLVFETEAGFVLFLSDLFPAIRRAASELLRKGRQETTLQATERDPIG